MSALGIDVGSTTVKVVVLGARGHPLHASCERHRGRPRELVGRMIAEALTAGPVTVRGITGSIGTSLAEELGATPVHEVLAVVRAVEERGLDCATIVELGGQDAKVVRLAAAGADMQMNDRCAAGTGATLDRVARRLGLDGDALTSLRLCGDLGVAAKCGVFAETDVVNLIKQGASREAAFSALARAIVVQNLAVLARGRALRPPVLLLGGPHAHLPILRDAWVEALRRLWRQRGIAPGEVLVPEDADLFAAFGAALHAASGDRPSPRIRGVLGSARIDGVTPAEEHELAPLRCRRLGRALPVRSAHLGIDAGSTTSKAALIDGRGALIAYSYAPSAGNPVDDARARLRDLARQMGELPEVRSLGVTGYGVDLVAAAFGADAAPVETIAHATAAVHAWQGVDVVVDVGGTDVKVMQLDGERVRDFFVSNQCSAGHGAFLAATAEELGVSLEEYADLALKQRRAPRFTVGCAVFMDTDRVTFQREGHTAGEVLSGLATALPRNIWEFVVPRPPEQLGRRFLLTGGVARNLAATLAHARYLRARVDGADVRVHPHPELCGAIGAALIGARQVAARASSFVGFGPAEAVRVEVRRDEGTRCGRCDLGCERSIVSLRHARPRRERAAVRSLVIGNACERGADAGASAERSRAHAPDLLAEEARRLFRPLLPPPARREAPRVVFGIPRVMGLYRSAPLLLHYLRAAGVPDTDVVLTPPTSARLFQAGARWGVTDPCFPSKLVLAHVDHLLRAHAERPIDVLLMPALTHAKIAVRGTTDTASCPIVAACGQTSVAAVRGELLRLGIRALTPELCPLDAMRLEVQLLDAFGELLELTEQENRAALEYALRAQRAFHDRCRRRGRAVIRKVRREARAAAVVLARPYHADPGVQHGISTELAARGLPVLSITSLPTDDASALDLGDVLPLATNSGCAERMWAARVVRRTPNLVAVDLSSFRCGQDASILGVLSDELARAGRPVLRMHDLDEDRPAASFGLRIETFLYAVRAYERDVLAPCATEVAP